MVIYMKVIGKIIRSMGKVFSFDEKSSYIHLFNPGKFYDINSGLYEGDWVNNKSHGKGNFIKFKYSLADFVRQTLICRWWLL